MAQDQWLQLGVGGIFALMVIREFVGFATKMRPGSRTNGQARMVEDLHRWHAPDQRGQQMWKNALLMDVVGGLKVAVEKNTEASEKLSLLVTRVLDREKV